MDAFTCRREDRIAWLELNVPGESVNMITRAVRAELRELLESLCVDDEVRAIVLISGKPDHFMAGADIGEFAALRSRAEALALVREGQALVNRFETIGKPIVAAIHGPCLGGGLEAALACSYRIATDHPKTVVGLPEVKLGIIPAAGGCQRLPRLAGLRTALEMILKGKPLHSRAAYRKGVVDELVHPAILEAVARSVAIKLLNGWRPKRSRERFAWATLLGNPVARSLVLAKARKSVLKKTGDRYPALLAVLEAVEHGMKYGLAHGLENEAAHFTELAISDECRNLVQVFFALNALKKEPGTVGDAPVARTIRNAAVVGAESTGSAIAGTAVARAGIDVRLKGYEPCQVAEGLAIARRSIEKRTNKQKHPVDRSVYLLSGGVDWAGFKRADIVVEAQSDDPGEKSKTIGEIESHVSSECVIAAHTHAASISFLAEKARFPGRLVGIHFVAPTERAPLVEVIATGQTAAWAIATAAGFGRALGKTVIVVQDTPGFWVNRILVPYLNEAGRLVKEGVPVDVIDTTMTEFGFPVGPITLLDEIGLDVVREIAEMMYDAHGERFNPGESISLLVQAGRLGKRNGRGFFRYVRGRKRQADPAALEVLGVPTTSVVPADDIRNRLLYVMLNEAAWALNDGVVRSERDGDIGAIFGVGFPPYTGGPLRYLDHQGANNALSKLEELKQNLGKRFEAAPNLVRLAERNGYFYHEPP